MLNLIFSYARDAAPLSLYLLERNCTALDQPRGQNYASASTLGPPPEESAIQTDRMSPPGIVIDVVANDQNTALAETAVALEPSQSGPS